MKVLVSSYACEPGKGSEPGAGWNWVLQVARFHDVWVITRENNRESIEPALVRDPMPHVQFFFYDLPKWMLFWKKSGSGMGAWVYNQIWQLGAYRIAKKLQRQHAFDLIYQPTFCDFRSPGWLWLLPPPFAWGPIGGGHFIPPGFESYFEDSIRFERVRAVATKAATSLPWIRLALRRAALILVADPSTEALLPRRYDHKMTPLVAAGIAGTRERPTASGDSANGIRILWVGGLVTRKALPILFEALARLEDEVDWHLTVVGDGPARAKWEKHCRDLGLSPRVEFAGQVSYTEVQDQYLAADCLAFTSLRDSSPVTVLEAMSFGLPVVLLDLHGASKMVTPETGVKVPVESPSQVRQDLAEAIRLLARDPDLRRRLGAAARRRVEELYDWHMIGDQLNDEFVQITQSGSRP